MDFNKIKAIGLEYAEKGKNAAMDLTGVQSCQGQGGEPAAGR